MLPRYQELAEQPLRDRYFPIAVRRPDRLAVTAAPVIKQVRDGEDWGVLDVRVVRDRVREHVVCVVIVFPPSARQPGGAWVPRSLVGHDLRRVAEEAICPNFIFVACIECSVY